MLKRLNGEPDDTAAEDNPPLSIVFDRWREERQPPAQTWEEWNTARRRFETVVGGDLPVKSITKAHVRAFKEARGEVHMLGDGAQHDLRLTGFHYQHEVGLTECMRIAHSLGVPVGDVRTPEPIRLIRPQPTETAKRNTLSSRHGMGAFPFHTDAAYWPTPARYILFHCVNPGAGGRPTLLIDPRAWSWPERERRWLYNEVWRVTARRPFHCTIGSQGEDGLRVRFDEACMTPVTSGATELLHLLQEAITTSRVVSIRWRQGDLLIVDNMRLLHARGSASQSDEDRVLARVLIRG